MLSVDEALAQVLAHCRPRAPVVRVAADALGLVLAEEVASDVDSPPHDKALVDGYAVVAAHLAGGSVELEILEEVTAGNVPSRAVTAGATTRVMTGAPLPPGADAVVMLERSQLLAGRGLGRVRLACERIAPGDNVMRRAASMRIGQAVVRAGALLRPIELGLLAEVGRAEVRVVGRPAVAVLATGNELVRVVEQPAAGKIRNSNGPMLVAAAQAAGAAALDLGIARDEPSSLRERIALGLHSDILMISGGVSAGVLDLVPGLLADLGVRQVFHKVHLKPGKPLWFGEARNTAGSLVFGLPGNPVSSFVCFELFVRPAIARLAGRGECGPGRTRARLTSDFQNRSDRPTYHPARLRSVDGHDAVEPLAWHGSGDLCALVDADALAVFEPGPRAYRAGDCVTVLPL